MITGRYKLCGVRGVCYIYASYRQPFPEQILEQVIYYVTDYYVKNIKRILLVVIWLYFLNELLEAYSTHTRQNLFWKGFLD